jgi:hypothetical protein
MGKRLRDKGEGWKDVIGMPDAWDKKNLQTCINNFMKEKFQMPNGTIITGAQWAKAELADAKHQHQSDDVFNKFGVKIKDSEMRIGTAMPNELWQRLSDTAPTLFTDKDHFAWFIKNFPQFKVAQRF